jgi:sugar lactone lactonase YvrE
MSGDVHEPFAHLVEDVPVATLGERPVWDRLTNTVIWVDIVAGQVHRYDPGTAHDDVVVQVPKDVAAGCAFVRSEGGLAVAAGHDVVLYDGSGGVQTRIALPGVVAGVECNDGGIDPAGRLWVGTGHPDMVPGLARLYRIDHDHHVTTVLTGITESNGIGWSPDATTMYYVDSGYPEIRRYDYDAASGAVRRSTDLAVVPASDGMPDGLAVDTSGCVVVALWKGGEVRRYSPDGDLLQRWPLPASLVTCPGFGGVGLRDIYVTTASIGLSADQRGQQSLAGRMFRLPAPEPGLPTPPFAG